MLKTDNLNKLYGLENHLYSLMQLYENKKLPKILMLSGKKGIGKASLIDHFLKKIIKEKINLTNENILFIKNDTPNSTKIDDIRLLKQKVSKTTLNNLNRFIIIDDAEKLSINCSNALLKIIEEPKKKDYFILINNQENDILDTIFSRCINLKIYLKNIDRKKIIKNLISIHDLKNFLDYEVIDITPGQFLKFNSICNENNIFLKDDYIKNINDLFNLYKKTKDTSIIDLAIFFTELKFYEMSLAQKKNIFNIQLYKSKTLKDIKDSVLFNLNSKSILKSISYNIENAQ